MRAAKRFCRLVDRLGEDIPTAEVESARAAYAAADEDRQFTLFYEVADHLSRRLAGEPEPTVHAAQVLAAWFLEPAT